MSREPIMARKTTACLGCQQIWKSSLKMNYCFGSSIWMILLYFRFDYAADFIKQNKILNDLTTKFIVSLSWIIESEKCEFYLFMDSFYCFILVNFFLFRHLFCYQFYEIKFYFKSIWQLFNLDLYQKPLGGRTINFGLLSFCIFVIIYNASIMKFYK